jgi:hypothetical protein
MTKALVHMLASTTWQASECLCSFAFWGSVATEANRCLQLPLHEMHQDQLLVRPSLPPEDVVLPLEEGRGGVAPALSPLQCFLWFRGRFRAATEVWEQLEVRLAYILV